MNMDLALLTEFFGWAALLNLGLLAFAGFCVTFLKSTITSIHSKLFAIEENDLAIIYMNYMANYKVLTFAFFVMPYLALKLMQ